jgi:ABC-type molybdate transport system substrate-binding protein
MKNNQGNQLKKQIISEVLIALALGLTYTPLPGNSTTITIVSGSELKEPLEVIETKFKQAYPSINLEIKIQGSQDIVNNIIDKKNDFTPTLLIPANEELISELETRLKVQGETQPFYNNPQPITKTLLVGIAWSERGNILFPQNKFAWSRLENALKKRHWQDLGGKEEWGSFDFITTDPTRSNSGQLTLSLWAESKLNTNHLTANSVNNPEVEKLFQLIKNSVYQPPRSTDILLQEFIARGPNGADVATVYESVALYRWSQANTTQGKSYQIYYLSPTIETFATAVVLKQKVSQAEAKFAQKFIDYLLAEEQQIIFAQYGFRPVTNNLDLKTIPNSPWSENIPGVEIEPKIQNLPTPQPEVINEIQKLWIRTN